MVFISGRGIFRQQRDVAADEFLLSLAREGTQTEKQG
jgi:hypothetical protein